MAWTSHLDALADKCQCNARVESSNIYYHYPSLKKRRRLRVLPGRNVLLRRDGETYKSPLASGLTAPFLLSYNGIGS